MSKLLLFTGYSSKSDSPFGLVEALNEISTFREYVFAYYSDLIFQISINDVSIYDSRNNIPLTDYDLVYFRKWQKEYEVAGACCEYLKFNKIPFVDTEVGCARSFSKLTETVLLGLSGLPVPKTLFCSRNEILIDVLRKTNFLEYPTIVKDPFANKGEENYLIHGDEELEKILSNSKHQYLAQEFIPNESDYRMFVLDQKVELAILRTGGKTSHMNNVSQGGKATVVDQSSLDHTLLEDSVKAAHVLRRQVAGVDIIVDSNTGRHYILEVNNAPQTTTGVFSNEKVMGLHRLLSSISTSHS